MKLLMAAGIGLFLFLWHSLTSRNRILTSKPALIRIDTDKLGNGIYFNDDYILFIDAGQSRFFSNKCTHAGCRITLEIAGELICSCHGSKFEATTGRVLRGPAVIPLKILPLWKDPKTAEALVKVE